MSNSLLELFDSTGKLLKRKQASTWPLEMDVSDLSAGLYWWKWQVNGKTASGKVVKR